MAMDECPTVISVGHVTLANFGPLTVFGLCVESGMGYPKKSKPVDHSNTIHRYIATNSTPIMKNT
jgi:hypothetical protein